MSLGIIVQVRSGSKRLKKKALKSIGDQTLIGFILSRLIKNNLGHSVVVATTHKKEDDKIVEIARDFGVKYFRGNENNVLQRYIDCSIKHNFTNIVRLTGDNPFTNIPELKRLIKFHKKNNYEYSSNLSNLPIGAGSEIFSIDCFIKISKMNLKKSHKEHINDFIIENKNIFKCGHLKLNKKYYFPKYKLTLDTQTDLLKIRKIIKKNSKFYRDYPIV